MYDARLIGFTHFTCAVLTILCKKSSLYNTTAYIRKRIVIIKLICAIMYQGAIIYIWAKRQKITNILFSDDYENECDLSKLISAR